MEFNLISTVLHSTIISDQRDQTKQRTESIANTGSSDSMPKSAQRTIKQLKSTAKSTQSMTIVPTMRSMDYYKARSAFNPIRPFILPCHWTPEDIIEDTRYQAFLICNKNTLQTFETLSSREKTPFQSVLRDEKDLTQKNANKESAGIRLVHVYIIYIQI